MAFWEWEAAPGEYGFGGDFGPSSGKQDSHFVLDGILFPDRSPHPAYYESLRSGFKGHDWAVAYVMIPDNVFYDVPSPEMMA